MNIHEVHHIEGLTSCLTVTLSFNFLIPRAETVILDCPKMFTLKIAVDYLENVLAKAKTYLVKENFQNLYRHCAKLAQVI